MQEKKDIIIIGGGIIGTATAYYLAKQGRSVTILEKGNIGEGSSYGNAGLIANGFSIPMAAPGIPTQGLKWLFDAESPFYIKPRLNFNLISWLWNFVGSCNEKQMRKSIPILLSLGQGSFDLFEQLFAEETVNFDFEHKGRLILFKNEAGYKKWMGDVALIREFGVEVTLLDADGVRQIEPNLLPSITHGIYSPAYAHITPNCFVQEMARLAKMRGVEINTGTTLTGFETSGSTISAVITTKGRFTANQIILAAGAWSPLISRELNIKLPIEPAKGYSLSYKRPPTSPSLPLSLAERKIAVTPMGDKLRFTSTLELTGYNPAINQRRLSAIRHAVSEYLPGVNELEEEEQWSGYRPATPDDLPIIGHSKQYENLTFATGHGTLGMTHGLITGKLVSQIISGKSPSIDLTPFRAERF